MQNTAPDPVKRQKPIAFQAGVLLSSVNSATARKVAAFLLPVLLANLALSAIPVGQVASVFAHDDDCVMELTKTDSPDPVEPGQNISYHLRLASTGTGMCTGGGVELKENYASATTFVSANPAPTSGNNLWNFGDVAPGAVNEVDVTVRVAADAQEGDIITNIACFWTREYDRWTCV